MLLLILGLGGCATWSPVERGDVVEEGTPRLFVVTEGTAMILAVERWSAGSVEGVVERSWSLPPGGAAVVTVASGEAPEEVAARLGWVANAPGARGHATVQDSEIVLERAYHPRTGLTVLAIGGSVLGAAALVLGGIFLVLLATGFGTTTEGRPLRVRGEAKLAPVTSSGEWSEPLDLEPDPAQARIWLERARKEHASIPAFAKLSLELVALGAPPELLARVHRAALQEIEHARMCFAVASAHAGESLGPGPLPAALETEPATFARVAMSSIVDGVIGEGAAGERASSAAHVEDHPEIARILDVIAADEAEHAALGWAIAKWCVARQAGAMTIAPPAGFRP